MPDRPDGDWDLGALGVLSGDTPKIFGGVPTEPFPRSVLGSGSGKEFPRQT